MLQTNIPATAFVSGQVRGYHAPDNCHDPSKWLPRTPLLPNTLLYNWATPVQRLLRNKKDKNYFIGGMYIEFSNSGAVVNPTPTIARTDNLDYFNSLAAPKDYLRVPISATEEVNTDDALFDDANAAIFYAQTAGVTGVHGLAFSDGSNSRVYGCALVVFPDEADAAQDIVLARYYFPSANQLVKVVGSQIGVLWRLNFQ